MTDTVNVPREPTEAMMKAADAVDWNNEDERASVINMWQSMLATAPKDEPVSELDWRLIDDRAPVGESVMVYWPRMALDDDGEPTGEVLDAEGHISLTMRHSVSAGWEPDNIIEANGDWFGDDFEFGQPTHWAPCPSRPQLLSNPQQLEGEEAAWAWVNGRVECDPADIDYSADEMVDAFMAGQASRRAQPEAQKGEPVEVESIEAMAERLCEVFWDDGEPGCAAWPYRNEEQREQWRSVAKAATSRELLEAMSALLISIDHIPLSEGFNIMEWKRDSLSPAVTLARQALAKHKGPQS